MGHRQASLSTNVLHENSLFAGKNSLVPAEQGIQEFTSNLLMLRAIMGPRQPEKEQICTILNNSLLNSLAAGNCCRRNHRKSALPLRRFT
jgi:hypothetical protein